MGESRSLDERVTEKEAQLQKTLQKANQYKAQLKKLQARKADEDRRRRTHKLIVAGGALAAVYGKVLDEDEITEVTEFLKQQRDDGFFDVGMKKMKPEEPRTIPEENEKQNIDQLFGGFFSF